ncbi:hypothetical protein TNCT_724101 [Trichonephila clavata]|uniref:Uncharacterized protein n=1 Tax=Trichonephila clavata TaxID=2740835 RepID=A0A8X6GRY3_TRICU|nr:hypothetical protein TNCT_724101 [Trichonephila clavata]
MENYFEKFQNIFQLRFPKRDIISSLPKKKDVPKTTFNPQERDGTSLLKRATKRVHQVMLVNKLINQNPWPPILTRNVHHHLDTTIKQKDIGSIS